MGYYKAETSNTLKCVKCPANSWSFRSGQSNCKCQHQFYREIDQDHSSDCKPTQGISSKDLAFKFIDQDRVNVSINRLESLSSKIQIEFRCNNDICLKNIMNSSNEWIVLDNRYKPKFYPHKYQFKVVQKMNNKFLTDSIVNFHLNQAKHENKNMIFSNNGIKCNIFENNFLGNFPIFIHCNKC